MDQGKPHPRRGRFLSWLPNCPQAATAPPLWCRAGDSVDRRPGAIGGTRVLAIRHGACTPRRGRGCRESGSRPETGGNRTGNRAATEKARFRGSDTVAELEVSFFGPFYGAYNVIALDSNYQYALIAGSSNEYLWVLSRTTEIPGQTRREYMEIAKNNGFDTTRLIWVEHNK